MSAMTTIALDCLADELPAVTCWWQELVASVAAATADRDRLADPTTERRAVGPQQRTVFVPRVASSVRTVRGKQFVLISHQSAAAAVQVSSIEAIISCFYAKTVGDCLLVRPRLADVSRRTKSCKAD